MVAFFISAISDLLAMDYNELFFTFYGLILSMESANKYPTNKK